jgi:hypothetical protein
MRKKQGDQLHWILASALLVLSGSLFGQLIGKMDDRVILSDFTLNITSYGADQKVPQSQVLSMVKDPKSGIIIFSTMDGVAEFDGYDISTYPIPKGKEFDVYKKLYFGKNGTDLYGVTMLNALINITDSLRWLGDFSAVYIDQNYFITIDPAGQLYFRDEMAGNIFQLPTALATASFVYPISNTQLIVSDALQTYRFDLITRRLEFLVEEPLIDALIEGEKWYLISRNNLYEQKAGKLLKNSLFKGVFPEINDFQKIDDYLVFASFKGLYAITAGKLFLYDDIEILPTRQLTCLLFDKEEFHMYSGTADKGFLKFSPKYFTNYYKKGIKSRGSASSVVVVGDSMVINSGFQRVMSIDLEGNVRDLVGNDIFSSLAVYGDTVLAGSWANKLWAYSLAQRKQLGYYLFEKDNIHAPFRDRTGTFWIGCSNGLYTGRHLDQLKKFLPDTFRFISVTISEDRSGKLWIGGTNGLYVLDQDRNLQMHLDRSKGLKGKEVRAFYEDNQGRMWIGTYGGGLYCYTNNQLIELSSFPNYLLGSDIFTLARDTFGNLLMTSNNGLRVIQEEALVRFLEKKSDFLIPYHFSTQSGIYNPEFNGGFINNYASIRQKHFFFPTIQGVVRYDAVQFKPAAYHLRIKQVLLDDQMVEFPEVIPRTTKFIRVELQNTHLSPHTNVYYQYRLGYKTDNGVWSLPQKGTTLTFSHLKPGKYHLEVRAIDASNNPNPPVVRYDFYLKPYFYETNEFYAIVFFLFSLLVGLFLWYSFHQQQRKAQQEMDVKNTIVELQLRAIQAQMNPHFIFNVLNRLVELISSAKLIQAERFVIDFAKLLRNILEQSEKDFISVREELNTLRIYLEIQRTRRQESFQYQILADSDLDSLPIPTMLIQPFLENAIVHGVDHAEYLTQINLLFYLEEGDLHIKIQDNGIGREQASKINQNRKNESKGIGLIRRKIELLRKKYQIDIVLMICDWKEAPPVGTEVHLIIKHVRI